jgi:hypothetical protein
MLHLELGSFTQKRNKCRKVAGINSRFDRMIATVNAIPTPSSHAHCRRASTSTSGTSSSLSHYSPQTPVDAYSNLEGRMLGKDFSIIKMHQPDSYLRPPSLMEDSPDYSNTSQELREDVPAWLSDAVSTVDASHPIRNLIPTRRPARQSPTEQLLSTSRPLSHPCSAMPAHMVEENIFAFRPPTPSEILAAPIQAKVGEHRVEDQHDLGIPLFTTPLQEHSGLRVAQTLRPFEYSDGYLQTSHEERTYPSLLSFPASLAAANRTKLEKLDLTAPAAPYSTPGPFVNNPTESLACPRDMSALYVQTATCQFSPSIPGPTNVTPPFSTPGPLTRHARDSVSHTTIYQPLAPPVELLAPALPEVAPDFIVSSSPDLFLETVLNTPAPSPPRLTSSKLIACATPVSKRIYFDSPAEDPIRSDPLDASDYMLELDQDHLDFRWEKFDPSKAVSWASENVARKKNYRPISNDTTNGLSPFPLLRRTDTRDAEYLEHFHDLQEQDSSPKLECEPLPVRSLLRKASLSPTLAFEQPSFPPAIGSDISSLHENSKDEDEKENVQLSESPNGTMPQEVVLIWFLSV